MLLSFLTLALSLALAPLGSAQNVKTVVVFVTATPTTSINTHQQLASTQTSTSLPEVTQTPSSTFATQTISSTSSASQTSSSSAPSLSSNGGGSEYDAPGSGSAAAGSDLGASGNDGGSSFNLSKGALGAIIAVIILVVLFGLASTILFVIAKRRSWTLRETLKRGSRRLTGRHSTRRRSIKISSPQRPVRAVYPPGQKRGLVVGGERDVEKGAVRTPAALAGRAPVNTKGREKSWVGKMWGGGWK